MSDIPKWAKDKVNDLISAEVDNPISTRRLRHAFARYIAEHEQPPVDLLLLEAREIVAAIYDADGNYNIAKDVRAGDGGWDITIMVRAALAGLRRGVEIGRQQ